MSTELLPAVGSRGFKQLSFKEQLYVYSLYLHHPDQYRELVGINPYDPSLEYVDEQLNFLIVNRETMGAPPVYTDPFPFHFVEGLWAGYLSYYNPRWYEEAFSPIDDLGLQHKRLLGVNLFTFPLLGCDVRAAKILRYLGEESDGKDLRDIFYLLVKCRAAAEYFSTDPEDDETEYWNLSLVNLDTLWTVEDIHAKYPIIQDSRFIQLIEDDTYALLYSKPQFHNGRAYYPLVPSELFNRPQFYVKNWGFLLPSTR